MAKRTNKPKVAPPSQKPTKKIDSIDSLRAQARLEWNKTLEGIVDAVVLDDHINGCMQFNASHFKPAPLALCINIMDMVVIYLAEDGPHVSANTCLFTMGYGIVPDDMRAHILF